MVAVTFCDEPLMVFARGKYLKGFVLFTACCKSILTIMHCSRSKGGPTTIVHYLGLCLSLLKEES